MGLGDLTTFFYQSFFRKCDSNGTNIIQKKLIHGLVLFIKLNSFEVHMFYSWSLSHNTAVPSDIKQNKCYLYLYAYNIVFAWFDENSNKKPT